MSKFLLLLFSLIIHGFIGCQQMTESADSDINTASKFFDYCNHYQFEQAEDLLVKSNANQAKFELLKKTFVNKTSAEMEQCKHGSTIIQEVINCNDSMTTIKYSMSYQKTVPQQITLVNSNHKWLVQLP